ncbi:MAG: extracellular solute-binding protein [Pseudobutyrivibrio sp.]|nr:extracellular solute-binding protein [Pseudobutyrivibrio sp.]
MKLKKLLAFTLSGIMMLSLAACGSSAQGEAVANDTGATAEAPQEAELNIMMSFPQYMEQWEGYCRQFEEKMLAEKNIKVTVNLEMPSSDQYETILQTRLTGEDAPDLFTLHSNNIGTYNKAGNLYDLSNEELAGKIYDNVKETVSVDGHLMAVPIESQAWGVLYNKDIFEQYGLTPPETLSDLKAICDTLNENDVTPFMLAFQEQWVPQLMTGLTLGDIVSGKLTDWLDRMYKDEGSYDEVREIFDVIDLIMQNGTDRAMEEGSEAGSADFANGKAAMYVQGTWAANTIMETNPDMKLGVFALPINDDKNCTLVNLSTSTTLAVYPDSKNLDLALEFANYVLDDEDSSALFQSCSFNPLASCHNYESASWVDEASKYVAAGKAYQDLVLPSSVTDEQGRLLQEYYVGSVTVDDIVKRLDKAFQDANALN